MTRRLVTKLASEIPMDPRHHDWGPWRLDRTTRVLYTTPYPNKTVRYEVDLDDCTTSAATLDWICQITQKTWADNATIAGLIRALDDVLHPQAHLCSGGSSKQLTASKIIALVRQAAAKETR